MLADHTIIDHAWLWRADHDSERHFENLENPVAHALEVRGDVFTSSKHQSFSDDRLMIANRSPHSEDKKDAFHAIGKRWLLLQRHRRTVATVLRSTAVTSQSMASSPSILSRSWSCGAGSTARSTSFRVRIDHLTPMTTTHDTAHGGSTSLPF